jgi:5-methylcytosine-specific restriction protein A
MTPLLPEKRKPLTRRQRVDAHDKHGGTCCVCLLPIPPGEPFIDEHIIPLELGGKNDDSNRGIAHYPCAKAKTKLDAKLIAKASRRRAKHLGFKKHGRKIPSRPFPSSRGFEKRP